MELAVEDNPAADIIPAAVKGLTGLAIPLTLAAINAEAVVLSTFGWR